MLLDTALDSLDLTDICQGGRKTFDRFLDPNVLGGKCRLYSGLPSTNLSQLTSLFDLAISARGPSVDVRI